MDPKLKEALEQLLLALIKNAEDAAAWAKGEIPIVIQEKIAFGRAWETAVLLAWLVALFVTWRWILPWAREYARDTEGFSWAVVTVATLGSVIGGMKSIHDVLLVWFAPRLYIVDWLISLIAQARGTVK